jgi:hypothetical protein
MKIFTKRDKRTAIDKEIDRVTEIVSLLDPVSEEYTKVNENLTELKEGKAKDKANTKISKDVIVTGLFSVIGILIIVGYEQANVMGSKALGLVIKGRV